MMVSPTPMPNSLVLVLAICVIFTISLTENLQLADGLSGVAFPINFQIEVGQTQSEEWIVINDNDEKGWVEFYASGPGSEFLTFKKIEEYEPRQNKPIEIFVTIPKDHPDNVELRPLFFAIKRGDPLAEGVTGASVNVQLKKVISIKIGDNPIYTPPVEEIITVIPDEIIVEEREEQRAEKVKTVEEKMAEINAANEALQKVETPQVIVIETPEVKDSGYIEEPKMDAEPIQVNLPTCGIWEMILNWFGIKSDCI